MFTRNDLSIMRLVTTWGGPGARVTVQFPEQWTDETRERTFVLRSTEGMPGVTERGHGIHINAMHGDRQDWRGAFKTLDMDEAIDHLVVYLNELAERQRAQRATESPLAELFDALSDFGNSLNDSSRRDFHKEWARVRAAFVAVDMAMVLPDCAKEVPQ
jgi:hypothetical protein